MAFDWTSLIMPAIGAFAGSGDKTQTTTSTSDPWAAAQPYMLRNLQDTEQLGNALKKNPFNPQQIEQYSNLFGDIGNFRSNVAPGLMDFANRGMNSNYQRERVSRPGDVAGYGGSFQPGATNPQRQQSSGLLGPFSVAQGGGSSGGLLDLNGAQNPFSNGSVKVNPETVNEQMISDLKQELYGLGNSPGNDAGDSNGPKGGGSFNGDNPFGATTIDGWGKALLGGIPGLLSYAVTNWGALTPEQKAQAQKAAQEAAGNGEYGTNPNAVGAPTAAQAAAIANSFARDFGGYSGNGSAGMSMGGAGGFGAGDYGDGTDR